MIDLEQRVRALEERNARVETDKAWETSWTRMVSIAIFTYLTIGIFLGLIEVSRPWLNAIVPMLGFVISTFSMPVLKRWWINKNSL
jgi:hypothetical protein